VENSRVSASMVEKERDLQLATEGLQARVQRLASELESSMVRCELLAAKGQMYDELQARTSRLQEDNQRLQVGGGPAWLQGVCRLLGCAERAREAGQ
jgi:hypothetical protein